MTAQGPKDLTGKVVLVTGGAHGIGGATAAICAARGAWVIVADTDEEAGANHVARINADGGTGHFKHTNVRDEASVQSLMAEVRQRYGTLDVLICAAAVFRGGGLQPEDFPLDDLDLVMDINFKGVFLCIKYGTPLLAASRRGVIVLFASRAGVTGPSSSLAYGASKGAVNGLGLTLTEYLAPRGIRVHVVCPGGIATPLKLDALVRQGAREGRTPEKVLTQAHAELGTPDGVARVVAFLATDEADYIRGAVFTR
jgi:NAD(P)-dependent dehydrogenase (short-subunit alcohol dehydrogenase family)